jgi:hypothetical protein
MKSNFMPMGYRSNNGYLISDQQMRELQQFFAEELQFEVSPSDCLRITDVFKKYFEKEVV